MSIRGKNTFRTVLRLGPPTPLFARLASAFPLKPTNKGNLFDRHPLSLFVLARPRSPPPSLAVLTLSRPSSIVPCRPPPSLAIPCPAVPPPSTPLALN